MELLLLLDTLIYLCQIFKIIDELHLIAFEPRESSSLFVCLNIYIEKGNYACEVITVVLLTLVVVTVEAFCSEVNFEKLLELNP